VSHTELILLAEYEWVSDTSVAGNEWRGVSHTELILLAEYEWVSDTSVAGNEWRGVSHTELILLAEYEWVSDTSVAWSAAARDTVCTHARIPCRIASHQESTGTSSLNTRHTKTTFCQTLSIFLTVTAYPSHTH
jgi:hypothetical protein